MIKCLLRVFIVSLRTIIGVGLVVYLAVSGAIDWSVLLRLVTAWQITLTSLFLLLVNTVLTSWRLCMLLEPHGLYLSLSSSVRLTLIGMFFNACLPGATGGDAIRIYYVMGDNHGRRTEVVTIMLLDRAIGLFALVMWPLLVIPLFSESLGTLQVIHPLLWAAATVAAVMLASMLVCSASWVKNSQLVCWIFQKLPLGGYVRRAFDTVHAYCRNVGTLLAAVGISLIVQTIAIGATLLLAQPLNPSGATWLVSILISLGFMANALPVTPGGLGVGEVAFNKLFELAGLTGGAETLLGWRILTVLIGLLGLIFYTQGRKRLVYERSSLRPHGGVQVSGGRR